jgi:hypothetical protein
VRRCRTARAVRSARWAVDLRPGTSAVNAVVGVACCQALSRTSPSISGACSVLTATSWAGGRPAGAGAAGTLAGTRSRACSRSRPASVRQYRSWRSCISLHRSCLRSPTSALVSSDRYRRAPRSRSLPSTHSVKQSLPGHGLFSPALRVIVVLAITVGSWFVLAITVGSWFVLAETMQIVLATFCHRNLER